MPSNGAAPVPASSLVSFNAFDPQNDNVFHKTSSEPKIEIGGAIHCCAEERRKAINGELQSGRVPTRRLRFMESMRGSHRKSTMDRALTTLDVAANSQAAQHAGSTAPGVHAMSKSASLAVGMAIDNGTRGKQHQTTSVRNKEDHA